MKSKMILMAALLLGLALVLPGCGGAAADAAQKPARDAITAPDFTYRDEAGVERQLSDLRGQVVLLNFWATWCQPCVYEMPFLQAVHEQLPDDAMILAISIGEKPETVAAFVTEHGLTMPILLDQDGTIGQDYRVNKLPTSVILDGEGKMKEYKIGPFSGAEEILARMESARS